MDPGKLLLIENFILHCSLGVVTAMILFMAAVLQMLTQVYPMDPGMLLLINLEFHYILSSRSGHSNDVCFGSAMQNCVGAL